jgi:hypothetical protein
LVHAGRTLEADNIRKEPTPSRPAAALPTMIDRSGNENGPCPQSI